MKSVRAALRALPAAALLQAMPAHAAPGRSLCQAPERTVFACAARSKVVSVCATGDLRKNTGALTYRFGQAGKKPELVVGSTPSTVGQRFRYTEESWAKGMSTSVSFTNGGFTYLVNHAHGVFGVDGGPNRAGVTVSRGDTQVAQVTCREDTAIDRMAEELSGTPLHAEP